MSESVQEVVSGASKEGNKEVAKGSVPLSQTTDEGGKLMQPCRHTDAPLTDRASAGFSAMGDKIDESAHGSKASAHKEMAKNVSFPRLSRTRDEKLTVLVDSELPLL